MRSRDFSHQLSQRYGFEEWAHDSASEKLFVWQFTPGYAKPVSFISERTRQIVGPDGRVLTRSLWRRDRDRAEALIRVDALECESRSAARVEMLNLLAQIESPLLRRLEADGIGDVAFGAGADQSRSTVAFVRANLVFFVHDVLEATGAVSDVGQALDAEVTARPDVDDSTTVFGEVSTAEARLAGVDTMPLDIPQLDASGERVYYKFLTSSGDVVLDSGRPTYVPHSRDNHVDVYFAAPRLGAGHRAFRIDAVDHD